MAELEKLQQETGVILDPERIPRHVAIIMDGNGRWATGQGLSRIMGHARGYETVREIVRASGDLGLMALTLYTFSTENWRRPKDETDAIMELIEQATRNDLPEMMENKVRLRVSGRFSELPKSLQEALSDSMATTANNTGLILNLALNYGGRQELLDAVRGACRQIAEGRIKAEDINEEHFSDLLYTAGLPDPDLLIRTAGEMRVSNFLLWQIAYAEIYVTPTLWPDFGKKDLMLAIVDYQKRVRKFGGITR